MRSVRSIAPAAVTVCPTLSFPALGDKQLVPRFLWARFLRGVTSHFEYATGGFPFSMTWDTYVNCACNLLSQFT